MRNPGVPYGDGKWVVIELTHAVIVAKRATERAAHTAAMSWRHAYPGRQFVVRDHS